MADYFIDGFDVKGVDSFVILTNSARMLKEPRVVQMLHQSLGLSSSSSSGEMNKTASEDNGKRIISASLDALVTSLGFLVLSV